MPSAKAPSSSAGATDTDFRYPSTSVNHSRTNRISRSSSVRSTNSSCLSTATVCPADVSTLLPAVADEVYVMICPLRGAAIGDPRTSGAEQHLPWPDRDSKQTVRDRLVVLGRELPGPVGLPCAGQPQHSQAGSRLIGQRP